MTELACIPFEVSVGMLFEVEPLGTEDLKCMASAGFPRGLQSRDAIPSFRINPLRLDEFFDVEAMPAYREQSLLCKVLPRSVRGLHPNCRTF